MTDAIEQTLLAAEAALASGRLWDAFKCIDKLFVGIQAIAVPQVAFRAARLLLQSGRPARALAIYKKLSKHANASGALDWRASLKEIRAPDIFLAIVHRNQGLYVMPLLPLDFFKVSDTANRSALDLHVSFVLKDERFFLSQAIEELTELINLPNVSEVAIQDFFVKNPSFIMGDVYDQVLSQPILERIDDGSVWIPDFMLRPVGRKLCDILEIKLPQSRFVTRKGTRRIRLASEVHTAVAQLREYAAYFDEPRHRRLFSDKYGLSAYKPNRLIIIGRRPSWLDEYSSRDIESELLTARVRTYDDLLDEARMRLRRR